MDTIITALKYLILFIPTIAATAISEKLANKNKKGYIVFAIIAISLPSFFAAIRGTDVGVDVKTYAIYIYLAAGKSSNLTECIDNIKIYGLENVEFGYIILAYITTRIINSLQAFLFTTELLIILPVYIVAMKLKDRIAPHAVMSCFLCIFYIATFNIMRQSIAAAWLLMAFTYLYEKKIIRGGVFCVFSCLFHRTSIIISVIIIVGIIYFRVRKGWIRILLLLFLETSILMILIVGLKDLSTILKFPIFEKYQKLLAIFLSGDRKFTYFELSIQAYAEWFFRIAFGVIGLNLLIDKTYNGNRLIQTTCLYCGLAIIIYSLFFVLFHSAYGYRLTWQLEFFAVITLPWLCKRGKNLRYTYLTTIMFYTSIIACWIIGYAYLGWHGTLPLEFVV